MEVTIPELIDRLGGATSLAKRLNVSRGAVAMWKVRGEVPAECRIQLWRIAVQAGVEWTPLGAEGLRLSVVSAA